MDGDFDCIAWFNAEHIRRSLAKESKQPNRLKTFKK
jgi:hypothetical protein